ncbi:MAG TPA: efflux RND transporter periplasmic adaptor subunit [Luteibacter sp.]|nr:efflux RND transporter periplasmic adaptor subunit [Luteibacter sp.]
MSHDAVAAAPARTPRLRRAIVVGLILAVASTAIGLSVRAYDYRELVKWNGAQQIPTVQLAAPLASGGPHAMTLPGHLDAWISAPIHARVGGYLKSWTSDIGSQVKAGDVLGTIDTPELDQQFEQAKADLARARANARLAATTDKRWKNLLLSDSVSNQEADEKSGEAEAAQANVQAAQADMDRLAAMESFKRITAPFSGTVTRRMTDVGDLIAANNEGSPALFTISDTSRMRLYVQVPQGFASSIKPGMQVTMNVLEHPGKTYRARLIGNSGAVNQASGTLLAQFEVDNPNSELMPGDYVEVNVPTASSATVVTLPATVLLFRAAGPQVAVLGKDNRVVLRNVHIGMDLGDTLEIDRGIEPGDRIIDHPSDSMMQGDQVSVATPAEAPAHGQPRAS